MKKEELMELKDKQLAKVAKDAGIDLKDLSREQVIEKILEKDNPADAENLNLSDEEIDLVMAFGIDIDGLNKDQVDAFIQQGKENVEERANNLNIKTKNFLKDKNIIDLLKEVKTKEDEIEKDRIKNDPSSQMSDKITSSKENSLPTKKETSPVIEGKGKPVLLRYVHKRGSVNIGSMKWKPGISRIVPEDYADKLIGKFGKNKFGKLPATAKI